METPRGPAMPGYVPIAATKDGIVMWPPLPPGPPPSASSHQWRELENRNKRSAKADDWRVPHSVFQPPTLAPIADCRKGNHRAVYYGQQIQPGSPWARGTEKAWVLDEETMWKRHDSIVHEVRDWCNARSTLSAQAQSNLGFDPFLYQLKGLPTPAPERFALLKTKLGWLARCRPDELFRAVHYEQLGELLGHEFIWVELPKTKTNGDSPVRKAW